MAHGGGGQAPRIVIEQHIHVVQEGDRVRIRGNNIEQQTNVLAEEIGQVALQPQPGPGPQPLHPNEEEPEVVHGIIAGEGENLVQGARQPSVSSQNTKEVTRSRITGSKVSHNFVAEERARHLLQNSKFTEVISLLDDLPPTEHQQMMLAESYLQENRESKALKCIETLKTIMTSSSPRSKPDDVKNIIDSYISNSLYIRALILIPSLSKILQLDSEPNTRNCAWRCRNIIEAMFKQGGRMREIAVDVGIHMINHMLIDLRGVRDATPDVRARLEASCLNDIGGSYHWIGKHEKAIEFHDQGLNLMKRQFGTNSSKYQVFGHLKNNIGFANYNLGNYRIATEFYLEALKEYEIAQNWKNEEQKQKFIEITKNNLQIVRNRMGK